MDILENIDTSKPFAVVMKGGSIGEKKEPKHAKACSVFKEIWKKL